jgi:hypothetical protein
VYKTVAADGYDGAIGVQVLRGDVLLRVLRALCG